MRVDLVMILLGIIVVVAMILTLLFGKESSRHGYGAIHQPTIRATA